MFKILVVEDEPKIRQMVKAHLEKYKYQCLALEAFDEVLAECLAFEPHLVILDINLPVMDGFYWCQQIRQHSKVPILFTSARSGQMDQIMGMTMGADDYLVKPYDLALLQAKAAAILRRTYAYQEHNSQTLSCEDAVFNVSANTLVRGSEKIQLSRNEALILKALMAQPEAIHSRDLLMEQLWDQEAFVDDNTLTVNVTRLRKRLSQLGLSHWILTHKRQGYSLL